MTVLVVAAHPDDEVLGCGGTIARLTAAGHRVVVLALADGVSSRHGWAADELIIGERWEQHGAAAKVLGAWQSRSIPLVADNRLDQVAVVELAQEIERVIAIEKPDIVFTHHAGDLNQDHVAVHRATMIATRPQPGCTVRAVYAYEVLSSTEYAFGQWGAFQSTVYVPLDKVALDAKLDAMSCYIGEVGADPHPRSLVSITSLAETRGRQIGTQWAEAFQLIRQTGMEGL